MGRPPPGTRWVAKQHRSRAYRQPWVTGGRPTIGGSAEQGGARCRALSPPVARSVLSREERGCCSQGRHLLKNSGGATCLKLRLLELKQTDIFFQVTNFSADIHLKFHQLFVLRTTFNRQKRKIAEGCFFQGERRRRGNTTHRSCV
ncbi:hypothetical protein AV530_015984 [Patagioenas fasciata monilis]|uniref:Uncharacterized protein n=1 Tax=Patagioenas fasciata monilis TaxID=372326 RepID=A0A1V4KJK4_PATFA|nr:hypothetical protein AV530_015984 [Patagioenas fasciata monilis]